MHSPASSLFFISSREQGEDMFSRCSWEHPLWVLLHPPAAWGGTMAPYSKRLLNAFIPMPCCSPTSYQWPYAGAQEKAQQEGCKLHGLPWPGLVGNMANAAAAAPQSWSPRRAQTSSVPPTWPWKAAGWGRRGDRQLRPPWSHPAWAQGTAALGPAGGHGRAAVVTATMEAAIAGAPHGDSRVPNWDRREGDLFQ